MVENSTGAKINFFTEVISALSYDNIKKKGKKLAWSKQYLQQQQISVVELLSQLRENNTNDYRNFLQMGDKT